MFLLGVAECGLGWMWDGSTHEENKNNKKKQPHRHVDEHVVFWTHCNASYGHLLQMRFAAFEQLLC